MASANGNGPKEARFFAIKFSSTVGAGQSSSANFDKVRVAGVSILNKADELAQVIAFITQLTGVKDVVVIGYSMGGLVARAYMQN